MTCIGLGSKEHVELQRRTSESLLLFIAMLVCFFLIYLIVKNSPKWIIYNHFLFPDKTNYYLEISRKVFSFFNTLYKKGSYGKYPHYR